MYVSKWVLVLGVLYLGFVLWHAWKRERLLWRCYVELSDWANEALHELAGHDRDAHATAEQNWEAVVDRHARVFRKAGIRPSTMRNR